MKIRLTTKSEKICGHCHLSTVALARLSSTRGDKVCRTVPTWSAVSNDSPFLGGCRHDERTISMLNHVLARLRAIDPRRIRRPFTRMRREYGVYGDLIWDFYGTEDEWVRLKRALDEANDD